MTYQVKIRMFEGPFDLLLHLISKRELDIYEVSLGDITEEYLAYLKTLEELDLEVATEFLVVAATLIEMKAARLLPGPPVDEEEALALSERDLLIARLIEYRAFKEAAGAIQAMMAGNAAFFGRTAGPGPEFERVAPDLLARISAADLATIAARAFEPRPPEPSLDLSHITPIRVTVADAMADVLARLAVEPRVSFRDLSAECRLRIEVIVRFLAVLELVKRGQADVEQGEMFGDITVVRLDGEETPYALAEQDEYEGTMISDEIRIDAIEPADDRPSLLIDLTEIGEDA